MSSYSLMDINGKTVYKLHNDKPSHTRLTSIILFVIYKPLIEQSDWSVDYMHTKISLI